jgi:hypothetical protein
MNTLLSILISALLAARGTEAQKDVNLLMIGNSYTYKNDLNAIIFGMFQDFPDLYIPVSFQRYAPGGHNFVDAYKNARTAGDSLYTILNSQTNWTWITMQEQSQYGGLVGYDHYDRSLAAAEGLTALLKQKYSWVQVIFYMTWGRRNGDDANPGIFPDFLTMNALLEQGYRNYAQQTGSQFSPVGLGFQYVYEQDVANGIAHPANDTSSEFYNLYESDGSHPSIFGSYLAACILFNTMTGLDPRGLSFTPSGLTIDQSNRLRSVAYFTLEQLGMIGAETVQPTKATASTQAPAPNAISIPSTKTPTKEPIAALIATLSPAAVPVAVETTTPVPSSYMTNVPTFSFSAKQTAAPLVAPVQKPIAPASTLITAMPMTGAYASMNPTTASSLHHNQYPSDSPSMSPSLQKSSPSKRAPESIVGLGSGTRRTWTSGAALTTMAMATLLTAQI